MDTISRRKFLISSSLFATAGIGAIGTTLYKRRNSQKFVLETASIKIARLPKSFEGIKIGFLTDIHISEYTPVDFISACFRQMMTLAPDIIILGGDYTFIPDNNSDKPEEREEALALLYEKLYPLLESLSAPDGVFAVLGNHDRRDSETTCINNFSKLKNISLLINQSARLRRGSDEISLHGVDDYLTGNPTFSPSQHPCEILIAHNPDHVSELESIGMNNYPLALCGHTHGGQINLPLIGNLISPIKDQRFLEGEIHIQDRYVYTSRGIGVVGIPIRINAPAEITLLTLTS